MFAIAEAILLGLSASTMLSATDLELAHTPRPLPSSHVHGKTPAEAFARMNKVLLRDGVRTAACDTMDHGALNGVFRRLHALRAPELDAIFKGAEDRRALHYDTLEYKDTLWDREAGLAAADAAHAAGGRAYNVTRDGKCAEAVMLYIHHLPAAARAQLAREADFALPLMPVALAPEEEQTAEYSRQTGCAACHVATKEPETPTVDCIGAPEKCPVWPEEFGAPFALHSSHPKVENASSYFYYKFHPGGEVQATLVDYTERCFPFVSAPNLFAAHPCKLLFIPTGIYLMQPSLGVDCCTFSSAVGAVPPNFLHAYTYKGTNVSAPDMYGNDVSCDYWEGPEGFKYWTVDHFDPLYHNRGHDILFQDGPTGVTWRWGNFDVSPQDDSLFHLPASADCTKTCSKLLSQDHHDALAAHVRIARMGRGDARP